MFWLTPRCLHRSNRASSSGQNQTTVEARRLLSSHRVIVCASRSIPLQYLPLAPGAGPIRELCRLGKQAQVSQLRLRLSACSRVGCRLYDQFSVATSINSHMKPYRSVKGGSSLLNLLAVGIRAGPTLLDKKKLPRFRRLNNTVGGLASSGTILASSTDGRGVSSEGEVAEEEARCSGIGGDTAVVGKGREDETRLRREGRASVSVFAEGPAAGLAPRNVALDTVDRILLPTAKAVSPYPSP